MSTLLVLNTQRSAHLSLLCFSSSPHPREDQVFLKIALGEDLFQCKLYNSSPPALVQKESVVRRATLAVLCPCGGPVPFLGELSACLGWTWHLVFRQHKCCYT